MLNRKVGLSGSPVHGPMLGESSTVGTAIARAECPSGPRRAVRTIMPEQFVAKWIVVQAHEAA